MRRGGKSSSGKGMSKNGLDGKTSTTQSTKVKSPMSGYKVKGGGR